MKADFRGWIRLPDPIGRYEISPYSVKVDRAKVKKLIEDSMTTVEKELNFSRYQHVIVIPGTFTTPGRSYGMICDCANPGMLSGVRKNVKYVLKIKRWQTIPGQRLFSNRKCPFGNVCP